METSTSLEFGGQITLGEAETSLTSGAGQHVLGGCTVTPNGPSRTPDGKGELGTGVKAPLAPTWSAKIE